MLCLLHFMRIQDPPVGIWWEDEASGSLRSYYMPGAEASRMLGVQTMSSKIEGFPIKDWFEFLEQGMPFVQGWEQAVVREAPDKYLERLNRFKQSA